MKEFDFNHPDFLKHNKRVREWYMQHYHKTVSEADYIAVMKKLRKDYHGKRACRSRCPSNLRYHYQRLNTNYGFFNCNKED